MDEPTPPEGGQTPASQPNPVIAGIVGDQAPQQQQSQSVNWREMVGEDGAFGEGWLEKLPEDQRKVLDGTKDLPGLFKRVVDLRRAASKGEMGLKIPGEGATPDEMAAWHKALGVPEKPEDYGFSVEDVPENLRDHDLAKGYIEAAHRAGLPPAQVRQLGAWFNSHMVARHEAQKAEMADWAKQQSAAVIEHFGGDQAKAVEHVTAILGEAQAYGIDAAGADLLSAGVWRYVADIRAARDEALAKVAALTEPDKATGQRKAAPSSLAELESTVTSIFTDPRYGVDKAWTATAEQTVTRWTEMKRKAS